jgi:AraC family transcriptional regulator
MRPVDKALWYIESHLREEITLDEIARNAGVSRFHLTKAFGFSTGYSVMRYVRGRRLSQAARALANGNGNIMGLALDIGYRSHEAFSRAFREQFGLSPHEVRKQGNVDNLNPLEAITMSGETITDLKPPQIVDGEPLLVAGISKTYTHETMANIPAQWQEFGPYLGRVPGQIGKHAYGVIYNADDEDTYDYLCAVQVSDFTKVPKALGKLRIAPQKYAVFTQPGHISTIRGTWNSVWSQWLPDSTFEAADAPVFELYPETFDPRTGNGGFELWVPITGK